MAFRELRCPSRRPPRRSSYGWRSGRRHRLVDRGQAVDQRLDRRPLALARNRWAGERHDRRRSGNARQRGDMVGTGWEPLLGFVYGSWRRGCRRSSAGGGSTTCSPPRRRWTFHRAHGTTLQPGAAMELPRAGLVSALSEARWQGQRKKIAEEQHRGPRGCGAGGDERATSTCAIFRAAASRRTSGLAFNRAPPSGGLNTSAFLPQLQQLARGKIAPPVRHVRPVTGTTTVPSMTR